MDGERESEGGDIRPVLCVRQGPLAASSSLLAPIRDTRRHPRSCVCHTRPLNHRVQNEDAAVIRIYLQPRACSQHAWHKRGNVTRRQKGQDLCSTECVRPRSVMSNTAFSFRGHFEPCRTYLTTCHERPVYQQQRAQRDNHRHKHVHIYKSFSLWAPSISQQPL